MLVKFFFLNPGSCNRSIANMLKIPPLKNLQYQDIRGQFGDEMCQPQIRAIFPPGLCFLMFFEKTGQTVRSRNRNVTEADEAKEERQAQKVEN